MRLMNMNELDFAIKDLRYPQWLSVYDNRSCVDMVSLQDFNSCLFDLKLTSFYFLPPQLLTFPPVSVRSSSFDLLVRIEADPTLHSLPLGSGALSHHRGRRRSPRGAKTRQRRWYRHLGSLEKLVRQVRFVPSFFRDAFSP